jgi:AraC family transcriptional activator of pobA
MKPHFLQQDQLTYQPEFNIEPLRIRSSIPDRLNSFEILFVKEGKGILVVDSREYSLRDNTFFCLAPGQYRHLQSDNDPTGDRISFSIQFFLLADSHANYYTSEWYSSSTIELGDLVGRMNHELSMCDNASWEIIRSLFKVFMIYLRRMSATNSDPLEANAKDKLIAQRFFMLLQKHYVSKKLVADYADKLCITPNYLNAIVKRQTGFPASYHIQQCIIVEAKRHAIYSDLRMKEVAERLGFEDYAHFSKFFKNYSGMNFSKFRRSAEL